MWPGDLPDSEVVMVRGVKLGKLVWRGGKGGQVVGNKEVWRRVVL